MRCGRAQKLMTAAVDDELTPRHRHALDEHVSGCEACRRELASTERMLGALGALPMDAAVPERLEQATLRRVRLLACDVVARAARRSWFGFGIPVFAVATAAVLMIAVGLAVRIGETPVPRVELGGRPKPAGERVARAQPARPVRTARNHARRTVEPPTEPPAELAAAPDLFMDMPILKNMERLQHFEAIRTTTIEDRAPDGQEDPSNG